MRHFNPRAPCGARQQPEKPPLNPAAFQSTRPVRGATGPSGYGCPFPGISIHAPRAGRDRVVGRGGAHGDISIHAPRAGRDSFSTLAALANMSFQSTRPVRGATHVNVLIHPHRPISIHAPRAGRDAVHTASICRAIYFNPRAPCGARRAAISGSVGSTDFNPRAPCGARRQEMDSRILTARGFQSTRPVRGATCGPSWYYSRPIISIHAPRAGRDLLSSIASGRYLISIHAPRAGRDNLMIPSVRGIWSISIHAPRAGRDGSDR